MIKSSLPRDDFDHGVTDPYGSFIAVESISIIVCPTVSLLVSMDLVIRVH